MASAFLLHRISLRGVWRWGFYAYLIFVTAQSTFFHQDKRLIPFKMYVANDDCYYSYKSIFADGFDRDALYFHLWTGHLEAYNAIRQRMRPHHRLLIVNYLTGNNPPFIYPFIRGRSGDGTQIVNLRRGQSIPEESRRKFDFVISFGGEFDQPGFERLAQHPDIKVYENLTLRPTNAAPTAGRAG